MKKLFVIMGLCFFESQAFAQRDTQIVVADGHTYVMFSPEMNFYEVIDVPPDRKQRDPTNAVIWTDTSEIPLGPITLFSDSGSSPLYKADSIIFPLYKKHRSMSSGKYLIDAKGRPIEALILIPIEAEEVAYLTFDKNNVTTNLEPDRFKIAFETDQVEWRSQGGFFLPAIPADAMDVADSTAYGLSIQDEHGRNYSFFTLHEEDYEKNGGVKTRVYQPDGSPYPRFTMKDGKYILDGTIVIAKVTILELYEEDTYKGVIRQKHHKRDRMPKPRTAKKDKIHNF